MSSNDGLLQICEKDQNFLKAILSEMYTIIQNGTIQTL